MGISLLNEEASVSFRKKVDKKLLRKEKAYEIKQLMKEKRSEEYEVLEGTVYSSRRFFIVSLPRIFRWVRRL